MLRRRQTQTKPPIGWLCIHNVDYAEGVVRMAAGLGGAETVPLAALPWPLPKAAMAWVSATACCGMWANAADVPTEAATLRCRLKGLWEGGSMVAGCCGWRGAVAVAAFFAARRRFQERMPEETLFLAFCFQEE